jgi:GNAT superfamily N-acetyltransferase
MDIRPVSGADDRATCVDIFTRSLNDLRDRRGDTVREPGELDWMPPSVEHLAGTDPDGLVLAIEAGTPVAFGCAYRRERFWFLSYLFVLSGSQGSGVGRALLETLLPPPAERSSMDLALVVEASQPASTMLYATYGIVPRVPLYYLSELSRPDELPDLPDDVRALPLSLDEHRDAIDRFDRALLGYARPVDHAMWAREAARARIYLREDGAAVGYAYLAPDDWLNPVAGLDESITAGIVRDVLTDAPSEPGKVTLQISGTAGVLLPILLRAGMRADEGAHLLYCSNGRVPPPSYLMYGGFLP